MIKIWQDGTDWVMSENRDGVARVEAEHGGYESVEKYLSDHPDFYEEWAEVYPDHPIKIVDSDGLWRSAIFNSDRFDFAPIPQDCHITVTAKASDWIKTMGNKEQFFISTEY